MIEKRFVSLKKRRIIALINFIVIHKDASPGVGVCKEDMKNIIIRILHASRYSFVDKHKRH